MAGNALTRPEGVRVTEATNRDDQSYEMLMARLVAVVGRLEQGGLPLAEALALYEEGVALGTACERVLEAAELRIQQLVPTPDGVVLENWEGQ